jgi:hypothetical protein
MSAIALWSVHHGSFTLYGRRPGRYGVGRHRYRDVEDGGPLILAAVLDDNADGREPDPQTKPLKIRLNRRSHTGRRMTNQKTVRGWARL